MGNAKTSHKLTTKRMNYAIEILEEQSKLLKDELQHSEGLEALDTADKLKEIWDALNKLRE